MRRRVSDWELALPDAAEFQLAMTLDAKEQIWEWLHGSRAPDAPERGLICLLARSPGRRRLTYLVREIVPPEPGDLDLSGGVEFSRGYRVRAKRHADELEGGLLYLHTHPFGDGRPSRQDLESGVRLLHNDAQHLDHLNPPLAIGVVSPDGNWMVAGCEFPRGTSLSGGNPRYASAVRVAGDKLEKLETFTGGTQPIGAAGAVGALDPDTQDRQIRLWSRSAQKMYGALRVGIVGLGGGGSILAEHVARAGVDGLVLVDFDVVRNENLNRQQGATAVDASVSRPKVDVAARIARRAATNPHFDVERVYGSVVDEDDRYGAYCGLLDCDVILHAADGHWTTRVLDEIAYAHLIPVISGGTSPETSDEGALRNVARSPIIVSGPGHPCFRCTLQYLPEEAKKERAGGATPGPAYDLAPEVDSGNKEVDCASTTDRDDGEPAPSVISLNAIVAGLMHLRLQDLTLGVTGHVVGERRFMPGRWEFERGRDKCREECDREEFLAAGQTHIFPLSTDHEFRKLREEVSFTPYW